MVIFNVMKQLERPDLERRIQQSLKEYPVTLLLGPRQCGKTTIAKKIGYRGKRAYFDLEDPQTPLQPETEALTLRALRGLVVIDEFQRRPQLFELLRVLADRRPLPARFLILGSASPDLVRGMSESLAGRVAFINMGGFSLSEVNTANCDALWLRGGFPNAFLPRDDDRSYQWRMNFVQSFLERDIPQLGIRIPSHTLRRFWTMLCHYHGQIMNHAEFARSFGVSDMTVRRYLDILEGTFMVRLLQPWHANIGKRLVKRPKLYFRDSGLLHALLEIGRAHV